MIFLPKSYLCFHTEIQSHFPHHTAFPSAFIFSFLTWSPAESSQSFSSKLSSNQPSFIYLDLYYSIFYQDSNHTAVEWDIFRKGVSHIKRKKKCLSIVFDKVSEFSRRQRICTLNMGIWNISNSGIMLYYLNYEWVELWFETGGFIRCHLVPPMPD